MHAQYGGTPVLVATQSGHTEIVEVLIAANADVNATSEVIFTTHNYLTTFHLDHNQVETTLLVAGATRWQGKLTLQSPRFYSHPVDTLIALMNNFIQLNRQKKS